MISNSIGMIDNWDDRTQMPHISQKKITDIFKYQFMNPYGLLETLLVLTIGFLGGVGMYYSNSIVGWL